jgi:hypothetical protein
MQLRRRQMLNFEISVKYAGGDIDMKCLNEEMEAYERMVNAIRVLKKLIEDNKDILSDAEVEHVEVIGLCSDVIPALNIVVTSREAMKRVEEAMNLSKKDKTEDSYNGEGSLFWEYSDIDGVDVSIEYNE